MRFPKDLPSLRAYAIAAIIALCAEGCMTSSTKKSAASPIQQQEELIVPMPAPVRVAAAAQAESGSFVITGASSSAWARKFSAKGATIWEHFGANDASSQTETFFDAAPMPDGSTFLCGRWLRPSKEADPPSLALLTHLDARGNVLAEVHVSPVSKSDGTARSAYFQTCLTFGRNILLHGYVQRKPDWNVPGMAARFHWFVAINEDGAVLWQREIPVADFHSLYSQGDVLMSIGEDFFFSRTDNRNTEVLRLGFTGLVKARTILPGPFHIVRSAQASQQLELLALMRGRGEIVRLSTDLIEVARSKISLSTPFSTTSAFRLSDASFAIFGSITPDQGEKIEPAAGCLDASLQSAHVFNPKWSGTYPSTVILLGTLTQAPNLFVTAAGLPGNRNDAAPETVPKKSQSGSLALDFVRLQ